MLATGILNKWNKGTKLGGVMEVSGFATYESANFNTGNYAVIKTIPYIIWHGTTDTIFNIDTRKTDFETNIKGKIYAGATANCKFVSQW